MSAFRLTSQPRLDSRQEWFSDLGGPVGVQGGACVVWWKQSLSSHSKTNRLSSEGCTIAHWSARQWLTLGAPSGTCFLLLCNPGACFPICAAPRQLSPILPEGKKREKETLWSEYPSEHTPQSSSLRSLSFHKLKLPHCTCCFQRKGTEGTRPPQKRPLVRSVGLQKSSRQARPILALALSQISWLMLGMNTGGFPNRRPPVASNSPPLAQTKTHCGAGDSRLPDARTRVLLKCRANRFRLCIRRSALIQRPEPDAVHQGRGKRTSDQEGNLRNYIFPLLNNYRE